MSYFKGVPYIVLWFASIFAGYAGIFCPLLPLMFVSSKLYRHITDFLLTFWQMYPAALIEFIYGCRIHVTGDPINSEENILLVMNHRTRTDWNFIWPAVYQATFGANRWTYPTKFVLKDPIRHIPGVGWMMQLGSYVYIKRHWEEDKVKLSRAIDFFAEMRTNFSLLIFPEGTDLTPHTKMNSDRFADAHHLQHYEHVLHPRTTGFCFLAQKMQQRRVLDAIYDVTIVYADRVPQNEMCLVSGQMPRDVLVNFVRYEQTDYGSTDESLHSFLEQRWEEKEATIAKYAADGKRLPYDKQAITLRPNRRGLVVALVFWTLLPIPIVHLLVASPTFRYVVVLHTVFLLFINYASDGFQTFEIRVHETRKYIKRLFSHEHEQN